MAKPTLLKRWANVTLRNKITSVTVLILLFGLSITGTGTISLLKPSLYNAQDAELQQLLSDPVLALQPGATQGQITRADVVYAPNNYYVALFDNTGAFLYDNIESESQPTPEVHSIDPQWLATPSNLRRVFDFGDPSGVHWRGVLAPVYSDIGTAPTQVSGYLLIASSTAIIDRIAAQYMTIFIGFGLAVVLLGAALTRILVTATFEPLSEVERTARDIARGDFSKRIHVETPNTEVGHVGTSLNVMLDRINSAFNDRAATIEKMQRFVGDAGHELRTPLASVRGYAELYRMGVFQSEEEVAQAMGRIEKEAIRMTSLVEDLLSLARLDASRKLEMTPLDLNALARDAVLDALAQDPDRDITVLQDPTTPMALGDEHKVRQIMTNLLANAIRHTDTGTPIEIAVSQQPHCARFEVRDHGEGVPEQHREKIFDRFWRADTSRNRETGGSGLGLSIVSSIVAAHKGRVSCHETAGGGATFRVDLPLAEPQLADNPAPDAAAVFERGLADTAAGSKPKPQNIKPAKQQLAKTASRATRKLRGKNSNKAE